MSNRDNSKYLGKYRIHTCRLSNWDYAAHAMYFVTICTKHRFPWFGSIKSGIMTLSHIGKIVDHEWVITPVHRPYVYLDHFVIMPDHVHLLVMIKHDLNILDVCNKNVSER